jgi:hypothetical protein
MTTSASQEHDAGAGDRGHASGLTANAKGLLLAAVVIVALAAAIWYLLPAPEKTARDKPAAQEATAPREATGPGAPRVVPRLGAKRPIVVAESSGTGRVKFVAELQHRFAAKNRTVSIDADGAGYRVLRLRWTPGKVDREHMDQLQRAEPFMSEVRGHGFTHMVMQVGERLVWQKSL